MSRILLSIEPVFVKRILDGTKRFEFRKVVGKKKVTEIVIYCTSPVMKVIGEVKVSNTFVDTPEIIWKLTSNYSGITKDFFDSYYRGKEFAVAYELGEIQKYPEPIDLDDLGISSAPQSFIYLNDGARYSLRRSPLILHQSLSKGKSHRKELSDRSTVHLPIP